ncbi:hypothetical protein P4H66_15330 [Paenibacillus dokdonensis]|uniref:Uncharacterized protein n=1 Tax=Paenibacillus dokdonensis TaxID=2567944 RepID=A0ABU6GPQ8_9BACL|nr:hypothetical protein [Paenibacillus dokdonensis]MEC0241223.1 hypothetical protein [Paenibacillus dokdonensis]
MAKRKSVKQPTKLPRSDRDGAFAGCWPLKRTPFEAAVEKPKAAMLPAEDFKLVALAVAEHEQTR